MINDITTDYLLRGGLQYLTKCQLIQDRVGHEMGLLGEHTGRSDKMNEAMK